MGTIKEDLKKLRELLSDEKRWAKRAYAKDSRGWSCDAFSDSAVCWCLVGGGLKVTDMDPRRLGRIITELGQYIKGDSLAKFNDQSNHRQVLALIDTAIATL